MRPEAEDRLIGEVLLVSWTTVALIGIGALVLIVVLYLLVIVLVARRFSRDSEREREDFDRRFRE